jgi:cell division protease FtsH
MSAGVKPKPHAPETAKAIDDEIRNIIDSCYAEARRLLEENKDKLHTMAAALIEYETLSPDQIRDIMAGAKPRAPSEPPSARPPASSGEAPIGGPAEEH